MADDLQRFIAKQFRRVAEWSLLSCEGLKKKHLLAVPAGAGNHILWELGHICLTRNYLIIWGCADGERLHARWEANFGFGSKVHTRDEDYPSLDDIRAELERGSQAVVNYVMALSIAELEAPAPNIPTRIMPDRLSAFVHLLSHEGYHLGKISLLRKLLGLRTIAELYFVE